jgi:hypothetical protein
VTVEEIERATQGSIAAGWSDHEGAILRAVEELLETRAFPMSRGMRSPRVQHSFTADYPPHSFPVDFR